MLVFDLDGTLVDTREAVKVAYRLAGVTMPDSAWGRPWYEWLASAEDHARKNYEYQFTLPKFAKALPLLEVAVKTQAPVITGASFQSIRMVLNAFHVELNVMLCSATLEDKVAWLTARGRGTYVDDDADVRKHIKEVTRWNAISPEECLRSS